MKSHRVKLFEYLKKHPWSCLREIEELGKMRQSGISRIIWSSNQIDVMSKVSRYGITCKHFALKDKNNKPYGC